MESSRRDLSNDMAEHKPILKNNQNTYKPRYSFIPKSGIAFPKTGECFYWVEVKSGLWRDKAVVSASQGRLHKGSDLLYQGYSP